MDRFVIRPATSAARAERQPAAPQPRPPQEKANTTSGLPPNISVNTQPPSRPLEKKTPNPSTVDKWKIDWLAVGENHGNTLMYCKACRGCGAQQAKRAINPATSADFINVTENIKKYVAFRHKATKQHRTAYGQ